MKLLINTDGIAAPNPGRAGIGVFIRNEKGEALAEIAKPIGYGTNNQAEYTALITGLEKALSLGADRVEVRSDSELMVRQVIGRYRVKNADLRPLYIKVKQLEEKFKSFSIRHVPREQNREADKLAEKSLDTPHAE